MRQRQVEELAQVLREVSLSVVRESPRGELSRTGASTLSRLERHGAQRVTTLAEQEIVSQPSMTGLVQRLEALGYLTRCADPADRRASLVSITEAGARAVAARRDQHEDAVAARLSKLAEGDLQVLSAALPALLRLAQTAQTSQTAHPTESHVLA